MNVHVRSSSTRVRSTPAIAPRPGRAAHRRAVEAERARALEGIDPAVVVAQAEIRRWVGLLAIPLATFVVFFGAALSSGREWLMAPAFILGPEVMILAFIYLMLTHDTNDTTLPQ